MYMSRWPNKTFQIPQCSDSCEHISINGSKLKQAAIDGEGCYYIAMVSISIVWGLHSDSMKAPFQMFEVPVSNVWGPCFKWFRSPFSLFEVPLSSVWCPYWDGSPSQGHHLSRALQQIPIVTSLSIFKLVCQHLTFFANCWQNYTTSFNFWQLC